MTHILCLGPKKRGIRRLALVGALLAGALFYPSAVLAATQSAPPPPEYTYDSGFVAKGQARVPPRVAMPSPGDGTTCWSITTTRSRGLWPYGRAIHLYTIWCGKSGIITYRESSAWPGVDFLCSASDVWWGKVGGGAGWSFVDVQAQAAFACDSPWWFDWHDFLMQRIRYHPNGYYETIAYQ